MDIIPIKSIEQLKAEGWSDTHVRNQDFALLILEDLSLLEANEWDSLQTREQLTALNSGFDFMGFKADYNWIDRSPRRVDGRPFVALSPAKWNVSQMYEQREALEQGLDLSGLDPEKWGEGPMFQQREALALGVDLSYIVVDPTKVPSNDLYRLCQNQLANEAVELESKHIKRK